jgi:hypothetical protein
MAIVSTGGMVSSPAAGGRPSMGASAFAASVSLKSASDGESSAAGAAGRQSLGSPSAAEPRHLTSRYARNLKLAIFF